MLCVLVLAVMFRFGRLSTPILPAIAAGILSAGPVLRHPVRGRAVVPRRRVRRPRSRGAGRRYTVVVIVLADQFVGRRLLAAPRPSPTLTVVFIVALVEAYGALGLLAASTLAVAVGVYLARLIATHPRSATTPVRWPRSKSAWNESAAGSPCSPIPRQPNSAPSSPASTR